LQVKKWYPLLNTKYKKSKPQLKIAVYVEQLGPATEESLAARPGKFTAVVAGNRIPHREEMVQLPGWLAVFIDSELDVTNLEPELNDVDGVFQLGPASRCKDVFVLSVTVAFAGNLANVSIQFHY